jgi:hypothetical protein
VVAARAFSSNSGAWPTTDTVINFASVSYDTHSVITTGAGWNYRIPVSGYYKVSASHEATSSGATTLILRARKNGSQFATGTFPMNAATSNIIVRVDGQNYFNAGDTIDIAASSSAGTGTFVGSASASVVQIERLSGPATIAASETVAAHYRRTTADGNQSLSSASSVVYFTGYYPSRVIDTHNFVTSSASDTYATIPVSGVYEIVLTNRLDTTAGTEVFQSYIMSGGTNQTGTLTLDGSQLSACITQSNTVGTSGTAVYCGRFNAGDIIRFKLLRYAAVTTLLIGANFSGFTIKRVGN